MHSLSMQGGLRLRKGLLQMEFGFVCLFALSFEELRNAANLQGAEKLRYELYANCAASRGVFFSVSLFRDE